MNTHPPDPEPSAKELETPETDKAARMVTLVDYHAQRLDVVDSDFARLLERRLTAALAENAALRADKERLDWLLHPEQMRMAVTDEEDGDRILERSEIDAARKEQP